MGIEMHAAARTCVSARFFYGRCAVFEDIAHGLETGKRMYARNAIAALGWLFPA